jgi:OOP family OmpA-OmpF porin
MRSTSTQISLAVACALALGVFSATANAQVRDTSGTIDNKTLLLDTRGGAVMSSGLCWHTPYGPAPSWTTGCHAGVLAPVAQYVAPAPVAPVVLAAAAPLVLYEKVAFDTNVLFDSNKSDLRPAARDSLDAFVGKIGGLESQSVTAIGYADRMGTDASNQLLSEDRVNTVKSYLVAKGVAADRVKTSAWGEKRPDTNAADCKDANNAKNVACMQPDRHVFIEASGTRIAK